MFSTITTGKSQNYPLLWYAEYRDEDCDRNLTQSWGADNPNYFAGNRRQNGSESTYIEKPPVVLCCLTDVIPMLVAAGETDKEIAYITRLAKLDRRYAKCHQ